jgi:hypothetical protein
VSRASSSEPVDEPITADSGRLAFAAVILSSANIIALQLYGSLMLAVNLIAYLAIHGHPAPRHQLDARHSDGIGLYPFPVPWWPFAIGGLIVVVVAILSWPPRRRFDGTGRKLTAVYRNSPGFLAYVGFFSALIQLGVISYFDGLLSVLSPYGIGPALCILGGVISFVRFQKDGVDAPAAHVPAKKKLAAASRPAEVLGTVSAISFFAVVVLGFGGIAVNQLVYLAAHGGALPPGAERQNATGTTIWAGHMPLDLPWWIFGFLSGVFLVVTIATWPASRQFGPQLPTRVFFRRTTAPALFALALLMGFFELTVNLYYLTASERAAGYTGPLLLLAAAVVAAVRWRFGPRLGVTKPKTPSRTRKAVRSHG